MTVWLPIPPSNHHQTISNLKVKSGYSYSIYQEPEYENSILKIKLSSPLPDSLVVSVNFTVARSAIATFEDNKKPSVSVSDVHLKRFLSPDRLVPIDGIIEEETYRVIKRKMSELDKAKAIYNYVSSTLDYDKSGIGWGRGDAVYACNARTGNCTDFHSLFIGMARAGGIPAFPCLKIKPKERSPAITAGPNSTCGEWAGYRLMPRKPVSTPTDMSFTSEIWIPIGWNSQSAGTSRLNRKKTWSP